MLPENLESCPFPFESLLEYTHLNLSASCRNVYEYIYDLEPITTVEDDESED